MLRSQSLGSAQTLYLCLILAKTSAAIAATVMNLDTPKVGLLKIKSDLSSATKYDQNHSSCTCTMCHIRRDRLAAALGVTKFIT